MARAFATFLMFEGAAAEAMSLYASLLRQPHQARFSAGGKVLMLLDSYGFSRLLGRFGVSWQLNLQ